MVTFTLCLANIITYQQTHGRKMVQNGYGLGVCVVEKMISFPWGSHRLN
jgi:hypothetical protein